MNAITQSQARDLAASVDRDDAANALASVILRGDLSKLSEAELVTHYNATCQSLDLNPLTRPFEYLTLNGKKVLYARKDATDQLRAKRRVSVQVVRQEIDAGLIVVTARATTPDGRQDEDFGAVPLPQGGEARANALMKAMTKAKRRVTLSICGLGFLDESELDTIPPQAMRDVASVEVVPETPALRGSSAEIAEAREIPGVKGLLADPEAGRTMRSFSFDLLDDQLSQFIEPEEIRAYLGQPKVQAAERKVRERGLGDRWDEIVDRHRERVAPPSDAENNAPNEEIA